MDKALHIISVSVVGTNYCHSTKSKKPVVSAQFILNEKMFRKIKKKPARSAPKRSHDDTIDMEASREPEDPSESLASLLLQKKKQQRNPIASGFRTTTSNSRPMASQASSPSTTNRPSSAGNNRTTVRIQKRPRSSTSGLGYGGGLDQNAAMNDTSRDTNISFSDNTHNRYDANSLSQLRQQQGIYQPQQVTPDDWNDRGGGPFSMASGSNENPGHYFQGAASGQNVGGASTNINIDNNNDDDDDDLGIGRNFIPIDENPYNTSTGTVLSGDDAFAYYARNDNPNQQEFQQQQQQSAGPTMDSVLGRVGGTGSSSGGATTAGRGGIQNSLPMTGLMTNPSVSTFNPSLSLHDVHQHFSQTQERLKLQADELEKSLLRRQEAKQEAEGQAHKHRQDLKTTGSSLEFYQSWRRDLIAFVGALREITKALPDMQTAWHELEQDMAGNQKWKDWEDDTFAVLTRYKLIHSVVGRQPMLAADVLMDESSLVDEFGRDISSQKQRILQQRRVQRLQIRKEAVVEGGIKKKMGAESGVAEAVPPHLNNDYAYPTGYPVLTGPSEMESFRERNKSLQDALKVVLDNLYEEYTSLPQLFELFAQWKRSFPAEYKECYASLTLADLATVLILVELLSLNDPLNESGGHDEAKWITSVCRYYECGKDTSDALPGKGSDIKLFDKESIQRLVSKAVLPTLQDLLSQKRTYNLLSARQSKALSAFLSRVRAFMFKFSSPTTLPASFNAFRSRYSKDSTRVQCKTCFFNQPDSSLSNKNPLTISSFVAS